MIGADFWLQHGVSDRKCWLEIAIHLLTSLSRVEIPLLHMILLNLFVLCETQHHGEIGGDNPRINNGVLVH